jgi:predicted esterase YcpF (UPF0227 family)
MKKLVVYFHGFNSSPNGAKVDRLKEEFTTLAVNIDKDPDVAGPKLLSCIDYFLVDHWEEDFELIFVGTSLGGWWASKLAKEYECKAVVVNPSTNPAKTLPKLDPMMSKIAHKYTPIEVPDDVTYFFAEDDSVIDHTEFRKNLSENHKSARVFSYSDGGHRFADKYFERVINYLKS